MKFIDLFAGIGGFHVALTDLGHECVFASEIKESLASLYEINYNIEVNRDIRKISVESIPSHDILCAGFPCQPFSKAGSQHGLKDEKNGNLFDLIVEIIKFHNPKYFILENVRNLFNHDNGNTWNYIESKLSRELGYSIKTEIFSPHHFGVPQHRERLFIVGSRESLDDFYWPEKDTSRTSVKQILDINPENIRPLEPEKSKVLGIWQKFLDSIPKDVEIPSFPIWSMEFGATYPFENTTPHASNSWALSKFKGSFGVPLKGMSLAEKFDNLPSYAKTPQNEFPNWKKRFIRLNREFYEKYKKELSEVVNEIKALNVPSWQKFEWNVHGGERVVKNYLIQFRGSGVRIKKTDYFPSLVTVCTQIPILGWEERYINPSEGARLQSLGNIKLPDNIGTCFSALGNAVNAKIIKFIANNLIKSPVEEKPNIKISQKPIPMDITEKSLEYDRRVG